MFYLLVPLLSCVAYSALLYFTLRHKPIRTVHRTFILYLTGVTLWAFLSFALSANLAPESYILLSELLLISGLFTVVAYYHFLRASMNKPGGIGVFLGYGALVVCIPFVVQGRVTYIVDNSALLGTAPNIEYTMLGIGIMALSATALVGQAIAQLIRKYRHSTDPIEHNRIAYLLAGFGFLMLFGLTKLHPEITRYPLAHIGNLGNAVFMTLAIVRYRLLDIRIVAKRGLVYTATGVCAIGLYSVLLLGILQSLQLQASYITIIASAVVALLVAILFYPLRKTIQEWIERLIYKGRYDYRHQLLTFTDKMRHVLNIEELAENMLAAISRAIDSKKTILYLPDNSSGDYVAKFNLPAEDNPSSGLVLTKDHPIVTWLAQEGRPLSREQMDIIPQFKALWDKERQQIHNSEIELLLPIKNKDSMVGILSVGRKLRGSRYRAEDLDLVMTMANQAGVVMENAQLYAAAKLRANTDELTGLFNHRYFHERLEEEVARGLRFGTIFSLIFLDLDLFKRYNDVHGHLAGDDVLRRIGECLQSSLRSIDMAFRYGGDEFAFILPGTSSDSAYKTAERIRRQIEEAMDAEGLLLTCSLGIASWPTDGVMREGLIQCADLALYHAKQWGNRSCVYLDVMSANTSGTQPTSAGNKEVLSTIYALAATVDARDHYTYGHSKRVSNYAVAIAEKLGLNQERIAVLRTAALLHDIGKIGIADGILNKPGPLTDEDWKPVRAHPMLGVSILKHVEGLAPCLPGIQYHHERYDGSGYPSGLTSEHIPLDARIIAIADAYEAMTSPRPYRERTFSHEEAIEELERFMGTQFDPQLVRVFRTLEEPTLTRRVSTT